MIFLNPTQMEAVVVTINQIMGIPDVIMQAAFSKLKESYMSVRDS